MAPTTPMTFHDGTVIGLPDPEASCQSVVECLKKIPERDLRALLLLLGSKEDPLKLPREFPPISALQSAELVDADRKVSNLSKALLRNACLEEEGKITIRSPRKEEYEFDPRPPLDAFDRKALMKTRKRLVELYASRRKFDDPFLALLNSIHGERLDKKLPDWLLAKNGEVEPIVIAVMKACLVHNGKGGELRFKELPPPRQEDLLPKG